jgi:hypothetical protein
MRGNLMSSVFRTTQHCPGGPHSGCQVARLSVCTGQWLLCCWVCLVLMLCAAPAHAQGFESATTVDATNPLDADEVASIVAREGGLRVLDGHLLRDRDFDILVGTRGLAKLAFYSFEWQLYDRLGKLQPAPELKELHLISTAWPCGAFIKSHVLGLPHLEKLVLQIPFHGARLDCCKAVSNIRELRLVKPNLICHSFLEALPHLEDLYIDSPTGQLEDWYEALQARDNPPRVHLSLSSNAHITGATDCPTPEQLAMVTRYSITHTLDLFSIEHLGAEFLRWVTGPSGPASLLVSECGPPTGLLKDQILPTGSPLHTFAGFELSSEWGEFLLRDDFKPELRHLILSWDDMHVAADRTTSEIIQRFSTSLEIVRVSVTSFSKRFQSALAGCTNLNALSLGVYWANRGIELGAMMGTLESLSISRLGLTGVTLSFGELSWLMQVEGLQSISLFSCKLVASDDPLPDKIDGINRLRLCRLTIGAPAELASVLSRIASLEYLTLLEVPLDSRLFESLERCEALKVLRLNLLPGDIEEEWMDAIKGIPGLQRLVFASYQMRRLSTDKKREFRERLPKVTVDYLRPRAHFSLWPAE